MFRFISIFSFFLLIQPLVALEGYAQDDFETDPWETIAN